jgi:uncharacterized protein (TIGR03067 family)
MHWFPAIGLAVLLGAPGPKEDPKKADTPSIVGDWVCTKCVADGREFPEEALTSIKMSFTADGKMNFKFGAQEGVCTYAVDPSKDPPAVDYKSDKAAKGNQGIYKVETHSMTFCFAEGGRDRPAAFASPAGSRILLLTLARVEKKKE